MAESRLVIGAGATGRTHQLRVWQRDLDSDAPAVAASPLSFVSATEIEAALAASPDLLVVDDLQWLEPDALRAVADAAKQATVLASRRPASGAEPDPDLIDLVVEVLTRDRPAERVGLLDVDDFAVALAQLKAAADERAGRSSGGALATEEVERLHEATAGSVGLVADAVAAGWDGDPEAIPAGLVDAVGSRVRRSGADAVWLVRLWAAAGAGDGGTDDQDGRSTGAEALAVALRALPDGTDPSLAERAARAGGLVTDGGDLIPLVAAAALGDLTGAERANLHDRLAGALAETDREAAAGHLLVGSGEVDGAARILASTALGLAVSEPALAPRYIDRAAQLGLPDADASLLRALTAFHAGSPDAIAHLDAAHAATVGAGDDRTAVIGYGIDVRDLRFESAAERSITGDLAEPLGRLAAGLIGRIDPPGDDAERATPTTPLTAVLAAMADAVVDTATGATTDALGGFSTAADDYDRLAPTAPFGITPHAVGALAALHVGDLSVVDILTDQAIEHRSGGTGEALTHRLIRAYGRLVGGDYAEALSILREHAGIDAATPQDGGGDKGGESPDDLDDVTEGQPTDDRPADAAAGDGLPSQRDRLLLASLEAAIARRSGDTSRLRSAWRRAEEALIRPSTSWLLADPLAELLAAGARLGHSRRIDPVVEALAAQGLALPPEGPGPAGAHWLELQVAIATEDREQVTASAEAMAALQPTDARSMARIATAAIWSGLAGVDGARPPVTEDEVVAAAEQLSELGDGWEASRILGQAALDEQDQKVARRLLELARISTAEHVDESSGEGLAALGLSERESEVALLIVEGRTHKEVGAQLFISPKTVEHHVAKIRQKVGASSRAELLSIIREAVAGA